METPETTLRVLMFPWLGYGHMSPYLDLAKKLTKRNFYIYFCSTTINLHRMKNKLSCIDHSIELIELHLPSLPELPPHYHTAVGLPPHLFPTLAQALKKASSNFGEILRKLKPDLLIYDIFQPWIPDLAQSYCVPAVHFQCSGAAAVSYFYWSFNDRGLLFPSMDIFLRDPEVKKMQESSIVEKDDQKQVTDWLERSCDIVLMRTCKEIEEKYIDMLPLLINKKIVPVGPLIHVDATDKEEYNEIVKWLNTKEGSSTVFVSFGSECYLSKKEMEELAYGLELSNVNFIWVIRFAGIEKVGAEEALPEGFTERVKERGVILEGWAPQTKILGHTSVGGFVSHCGWSSVSESINFGVPIIAIPMHNDQPLNARLAVELGVGMEVMKGENLEFGREEIAKVIKKVIVEESGENVRRKAKELGEKMRKKGEEEIDGVAEELKKIVHKSKQKK